jgi:hypothetical protein
MSAVLNAKTCATQVVILSLVRNSGSPRTDVIQERVTIGFLQVYAILELICLRLLIHLPLV